MGAVGLHAATRALLEAHAPTLGRLRAGAKLEWGVIVGKAPRLLMGGGTVDLKKVIRSHRLTLVALWASWCGPCREELRTLADLEASRDGLFVLAVNVDVEREAARRLLRELDVDLTVIEGRPALLEEFGIVALPVTIALDDRGRVQWAVQGELSYHRALIDRWV